MSEARLLSLVRRYPNRTALARHVRDGAVFAALRRMEDRGLVTHRRERYALTRLGVEELVLTRGLARLVVQARLEML
jgi:DNA-binding PadR family transcriptional regulator